ncbi:MAG: hypothetical protein ACOY0R_09410, partial [Chloroflexota bacterium]
MNHKNKTGMHALRALSILVIAALTLSGISSAVAMGNNAPSAQEENPPQNRETTFEIEGIIPNAEPPISTQALTIGTLLYDQLNHFELTAAISQNFDDKHDSLDSEIADDFVIPATDGVWEITELTIFSACQTLDGRTVSCGFISYNVRIYEGGGAVPGKLIYSANNLKSTSSGPGYDVIEEPNIALAQPVYLQPGTYWLSVQVNMDYRYGYWGWIERSVQNGNWHAFRNPGGGWKEGCLEWCTKHPKYPDMMFKLHGNAGGSSKILQSFSRSIVSIVEQKTLPLIYAVSSDGKIYVLDSDTGAIKTILSIGASGGLALSPNGNWLYAVVTKGNKHFMSVLDAATKQEVALFNMDTTSDVNSLYYGGPGRIYYYDIVTDLIKSMNPTDGTLKSLPRSTSDIQTNLTVSPDGTTLCGSNSSKMFCYDITTDNPPEPVETLVDCSRIYMAHISQDSSKIYVFCVAENFIRVINLETMEQTEEIPALNGNIESLGLNFVMSETPDGKRFMLNGDGYINIFDVESHLFIHALEHENAKVALASKDNQTFYAVYIKGPSYILGIYHIGTFEDVYWKHWARPWIKRLYDAQITGGCKTSPLFYCPEQSVTRAQMAVFIGRGIHGPTFTPSPASGTAFGDIPSDHWAAAWIEQ